VTADRPRSTPPLPPSTRLTAFRRDAAREDRLSDDEMRQIVRTARELLGEFYVHLPHKRAMHAVDPLRRLRLLEQRVTRIAPRRFHDEMLSIFAELRDRHTLYHVRRPYRNHLAALPFRVQGCVARVGARRRLYVVTEVAPDWLPRRPAKRLPFVPGVEITHWNGAAIERTIDQNARWQGGSNRDAQIARGIANLTDRVLTFTPLPDEDWVELRYRDGKRVDEIRVEWRVFKLSRSPEALDRFKREYGAHLIGIDSIGESIRRGRKMRFRPGHMRLEDEAARGAATLPTHFDDSGVSSKPDVVIPSVIERGDRRYGLLRLWTFDVQDVSGFVDAVLKAIRKLDARDGLIIDVRSNGGGNIAAGERLLQVFTPWRIEPQRVQFLTTESTRAIAAGRYSNYAAWRRSLRRSVMTGEAYSDALPIERNHIEYCNSRGQQYHGPVVLIVDALSYSTTDVFAAGFQDNRIGQVLGTDGCTGAGGGNPWSMEYIESTLAGRSWALPDGTSFDIAVRRNVRVGRRAGLPVEDLGVVPDDEHALTRRDVLGRNDDLMDKAISMLAAQGKPKRLDVDVRFADGVAQLEIDTAGLTELDLYLDGRPAMNRSDLTDGRRRIDLAADPDRSHKLVIYGFAGRRALAATRRMGFGTGSRSQFEVEMSPLPTAP
jgi:C-terminal processing protease CtpA/Prc